MMGECATHYLLRQAKAVRNACAHPSNMLNGFSRTEGAVATNARVSDALVEAGISRRVRAAKMRNPRLQQIATLLFLHARIVPEGAGRSRAKTDLGMLRGVMDETLGTLSGNDAVRSSFEFLSNIILHFFQKKIK